MATYSEVLRQPGVIRVVSSQLLARFPFGMMTLVFVLHIYAKTGSYAIAGLAVGFETLGVAIASPVLGRWMGRFGVRRTILIAASISTATIVSIGVAPISGEAIVALCLVVGLSSPPIQSAVRTIYPKLIDKRGMGTLYALDASLQEIIWILGPVMATFIAAASSTTVGVLVMAFIQISGAIWFCSNREVSALEIPEPKRRLGGVLKQKIVLVNVIVGALLVGSFSGVEVGTVALFDKSTAGFVIAALSAGSLIGGFALGRRTKTRYALTRFLAVVTAGYFVVFLMPSNAVWLAASWFIAGLCVAPALGLLGAIIGAGVKTQDAPEAYGWVGSGQTAGYAAAAAITGFVIDGVSAEASLLVAGACGLAATLVAWYSAKFTPVISSQPEEES